MTLKNAFKNPDEVKFIFGLEIDHGYSAKTFTISQTRYIDDVGNHFNQQDAKGVMNPCEAGVKSTKDQSPKAEAEFMIMKGKSY
ncbi:LOW QUALITY PROTEIN: polyprotein [Phytophthora megakarya]|uniref:Polyprotein n=1 Tax=Phytophthora megakarya TaxID=4795 RepID=A0A225W9C1_9STRA|nr:LOW QUALITY PROTEIN: polyprotein [Phytophthora megakarya]